MLEKSQDVNGTIELYDITTGNYTMPVAQYVAVISTK